MCLLEDKNGSGGIYPQMVNELFDKNLCLNCFYSKGSLYEFTNDELIFLIKGIHKHRQLRKQGKGVSIFIVFIKKG